MDFGEILKQWDQRKAGEPERPKREIKRLLEKYPPTKEARQEKEAQEKTPRQEAAMQRRRLRSLEPQETLDLHGLSVEKAVKRIDSFLRYSSEKGLERVLIVHGKGLHSKGMPILGKKVKARVAMSPYAGEFGIASRKHGGSGALWIVLR